MLLPSAPEEGGWRGRTSSECSTQAISQGPLLTGPGQAVPSCLIEGKPRHSGPKTQGQEGLVPEPLLSTSSVPTSPRSAPWMAPALQRGGRPASRLLPRPSTLRRPPSCTGRAAGAQLAAHQPSPLLPGLWPGGSRCLGRLSLSCPGLRQAAACPPHVVHADRLPVLRNLPWPHLSPVSFLACWTLHGLCCSLHF